MRIIEQDILTIESGIIAHQVNCQGEMGAGLALKIARKWPEIEKAYVYACNTYSDFGIGLGEMCWDYVSDSLIVANLFAQERYGMGKRHTDYEALNQCLDLVNELSVDLSTPLYLPYGLGCGLAGGSWAIVSAMIDEQCPNAIVCRHAGMRGR